MNYIITHENGIQIFETKTKKPIIKSTMKQYLNRRLNHHLTNYDGRVCALKTLCKIHRDIPLFIDYSCVLYHTHNIRNTQNILINYCNVLHIQSRGDERSMILFKDMTQLFVTLPVKKLKHKHKKCFKVINTLKQKPLFENVF